MVGEKKQEKTKLNEKPVLYCVRGRISGIFPPVLIVSTVIVFFMLFFNPEKVPYFPGIMLTFLFCFFLLLSVFSRMCGKFLFVKADSCPGFLYRHLRFFSSKSSFFAAVAAGILLAGFALFRIHRDSMAPVTLASLEDVSAAGFELKGDPVPMGKKYYRAEAAASRFFYPDGTEFSASGKFTVFFPVEIVRAALPENTARGHKRIYISGGLSLLCSGRFYTPEKAGGGLCFYVSELSEAGFKPGIFGKILEARSASRMNLLKILYGWGDAGGFFLALSSGMREFMDESISGIFRRSGLSHILALSGMHLGIIGGAVLWIGGKTGGKRFAVRISLLVLIFFLFFAGYSPSLFRACLFSLAVTAVRRIGFPVRFLPVLACVFCIHILIMPADIYSVSFQLSYLATTGIFSAGEFFKEVFNGFIPEKLRSSVSVSLGAQFAVFPVSMSVFGMFAPAGIAAGLLLSFPVSFFLVSGFCCLLFSALFPCLYGLCGFFMTVQYKVIYGAALFFSGFPVLNSGQSILYAPASMCILYSVLILSGSFVLRVLRLRRMLGVDFSGL